MGGTTLSGYTGQEPETMNPNPSHSTRFQPGNRANPEGRPKGRTLSEEIRLALEKNVLCGKPLPDGMTASEALAEAILFHAIQGAAAYANIALDRTEGKVPVAQPQTFSMKDVQARRMARRAAYRDPDEPEGL
jgi:hypothetical protein